MEQTRIFQALQGVRSRAAVDVSALEQILVRFSELVVEHPRIKEIDINPLVASAEQIVALDARIILHGADVAEKDLPRTAIRPYPRQYMSTWRMKDGTEILIRPIRAEDEPLMAKFHETVSAESVYLRYFHMETLSARAAHERLIKRCFIDYDREMALVAERAAGTEQQEIIGVARLNKMRSRKEAEVAVLISDCYQHLGVGTELLRRLIAVSRDEGLSEIVANILPENAAMQGLANHFGFVVRHTNDPGVVTAVLNL